jgi:hypothetical protein
MIKRALFKVDTGANRNTVNREWLHACGYDDAWIMKTGKLLVGNHRPTVATNVPVDDCYEIVLPEVKIGIWTGQNWTFLVRLRAPEQEQFRRLFGTDSLRFFNWEFDYEQGICRYEAITGKEVLLPNQKVQSIHSLDDITVSKIGL